MDFLFASDVVVTFFCAYQNDDFTIVDDWKQISKNYLSGWFSVDLLACIPFGLLGTAFSGNDRNKANLAALKTNLKLIKLIKLLRILKIVKE